MPRGGFSENFESFESSLATLRAAFENSVRAMGPGDIESSLSLRAGLRQASQGHAALKEMAASEDADDAARVEMEIQLRAQESAKKRVTK